MPIRERMFASISSVKVPRASSFVISASGFITRPSGAPGMTRSSYIRTMGRNYSRDDTRASSNVKVAVRTVSSKGIHIRNL